MTRYQAVGCECSNNNDDNSSGFVKFHTWILQMLYIYLWTICEWDMSLILIWIFFSTIIISMLHATYAWSLGSISHAHVTSLENIYIWHDGIWSDHRSVFQFCSLLTSSETLSDWDSRPGIMTSLDRGQKQLVRRKLHICDSNFAGFSNDTPSPARGLELFWILEPRTHFSPFAEEIICVSFWKIRYQRQYFCL